MSLVSKASTPQALRDEIVTEVLLRAWQNRAAARVGRISKGRTARAEQAAVELENLARDLDRMELINAWPAGLTESK